LQENADNAEHAVYKFTKDQSKLHNYELEILIQQIMLGEQIIEFKGKVTGQRVLEVESPATETSLTQTGIVNGTQVSDMATFVGRPTSSGVFRGVGKGVIMARRSEIATFEGYGVGGLLLQEL
jgi:hypothetical protein